MDTGIPEIKNPLKHAGTHRFQRLASEMDFSYVKIEERHEADFLAYAEKLSEQFQFYDINHSPAGNWRVFFDTSVPENRPHKAMFIAFLRLLEALHEHTNGLSQRHLDFYYREVLQFTEREVKPSQVHLFFKCAKTLKERLVEKNASLFAGENEDGKKILFELVDEIVVNQTQVSNFFTLFRHDASFGNRLFSKDATDLLSASQEDYPTGLPTFGEHQWVFEKQPNGEYIPVFREDFTMDQPEAGFAISTPVLRMEEGRRTLRLVLEVGQETVKTFRNDQFDISVTTEEGWFTLTQWAVNSTLDELTFNLELENTDPGILDYNPEVHGGAYHSPYPVLRVLLKNTSDYAYATWKSTRLKNIRLKVGALGVRSLMVQNKLTPLDPSKPFGPFGPIPVVGDEFYIGHSDIFKNKLTLARIHLNWKNIAKDQFSDHYQYYSTPISNQSFTVEASVLEDKEWSASSPGLPLFNQNSARDPHSIDFDFTQYTRKKDNHPIGEWDYRTRHGYLRLKLTGPDHANFQAFGHTVYSREVMQNNLQNPPRQLNQPYTPQIESLTLDYETEEVTFFAPGQPRDGSEVDGFYHVEPFGQQPLSPDPLLYYTDLFPQYLHEGEFYVGLEGLAPPQSVSVLFQLEEGTADANQSQIQSGVQWAYLSGNEWKVIDRLRISKDTTRNLLNTGIIRFDFPKDIDTEHTRMPDGKYWIKASIPTKAAGIDRIRNIHTHAVAALESDPELSDRVISPDTISKLQSGGKGIAEISQPYASFGGTVPDTTEQYYARVTERLRHKDRGVMIWDYERLVLDNFPALYKVKCLNHTNYQTEMVAGHVMMAVIPNLRDKGIRNPFQPRMSIHRRMEIYDFLRERISPFIYMRVENPIYEPIHLSFNVGFHAGYDEGFYGKKLHSDLQEFLSPWAFETEEKKGQDLVFGGELHKSVVLKFIEDLEYVDFVNDFTLFHIYQDPTVQERFEPEMNNSTGFYASYRQSNPDTACDIIKMAFQVGEQDQLTSLIEIKVRFLKGLMELDGITIEEKFIKELYKSLERRASKGEAITKTLVRILVKNIYYVDRIVSLSFHKTLPDGYIMEDVDVAVAKSSRSIMVTSEQHRIGVYRAGDYNCEGNVVIGIGFMIVEADFIIPEVKTENYEYQAR